MNAVLDAIDRTVPPEALQARAEALVSRLLERAARTDAERRIPGETVQDLRDAELFRATQPREFGGFAMRPIHRLQIARILARGCGSTAWVYAVLSGHAALIALFPRQARLDVWGEDDTALVASAFAPTGRATAVEGGFILDGRFPFSSGCDLAHWVVVGATVPAEGPSGQPRNLLVPLDSITILDDWHTLGLRGTGSKTLQADKVFVPAHRVTVAHKLDHTTSPFSLGAVAVGIAEGAVERFVEHTVGRVSPVTGRRAADSEVIQALVAESTAEIDAAWLLLERDVVGYDKLTLANQPQSELDKARIRRDQGYVGRLVGRAVERLYTACGGSGAYDKTPLQRVFRDAHSAVLHPALSWEVAAPQAGRFFLKSEFVSAF